MRATGRVICLPFLAQGANMAIKDGMVLARNLDAYDIPEHCAATRWRCSTAPRALCLVRWRMCRATTIRSPVLAQAFMEREFAPRAMGAHHDWLYEYDALSVPV